MMFLHYISILLLLVCAVCSSDEFKCRKGTQLFQQADGSFECLFCSDCPRGLVKVKNCSLESDTTCESCDAHNYYHDEEPHCRPCSECLPGKFINRNCTKFLDTECKPCSNGTFSSHINSNSCAKCRECSRGFVKIKNCSLVINTICELCDDHSYYHDEEQHCRPCSGCPPGEFMKNSCSKFLDTKCEPCPNGTFSSHTNFSYCTKCNKCTKDYISECNSTQNSICKTTDTESNGVNIAAVVVPAAVGVVAVIVAVFLWRKRKNGVTKENNDEEKNLSNSQTGPAVAYNRLSVLTLAESNTHHGPLERSEEDNVPLLTESSIQTRTPTGDVPGGNVKPTGVEGGSGGEAIRAQGDTRATENQSTSGAVEEDAGGNHEPIQVEAGSGEEAIRAQDDTGSRENQSTSGAIEDAGGNHEPIQEKSGIVIYHSKDDLPEAIEFKTHLENDIVQNLKVTLSEEIGHGKQFMSILEEIGNEYRFLLIYDTKNLSLDRLDKWGVNDLLTEKINNGEQIYPVIARKNYVSYTRALKGLKGIAYWRFKERDLEDIYIKNIKRIFNE